MKALLPKNTKLSRSFVAGIDAISAKNVYAVGSGGRQDEGGPFVPLHDNGHAWSRLALVKSLGGPVAIISDGHGGFWIPVMTGFPGNGSVERYSHGKLSSVRLPYRPRHLPLWGTAAGNRTAVAFAVGFYRKSFPPTSAVILRYGS